MSPTEHRSSLPVVGQPERVLSQVDGAVARQEEQRAFRPDIYWYLSFRCNLACAHCSVLSSPHVDTSDDLDTKDALQVVDQMAELNVRTTMMSGGEVLMRPDALILMEALGTRGIRIGLETNGLLFRPPFFDLALRYQPQELFGMTVSLDGGTAETHERLRGKNTFDRTIANLHALNDQGIKFKVQCVLNRENYHTIPDLFELARSLAPNLEAVLLATLNPVGRGDELVNNLGLDWRELHAILALIARELKDFDEAVVVKMPPATIPPKYQWIVQRTPNALNSVSCQFPLLGVLPNGDITICAVSRENEDLYYGNIREKRLKQVWLETRMDMLRSRYVAAKHLEGICGDCIWQTMCKGSCRAWAYEEGGDFDAPFPICVRLDEAGEFPNAYRISKHRAGFGDGAEAAPLLAAGCGCSTA